MKTFVNIFNELNESETEAYSIKKKVLIESNEIKVINEKCATNNKELNEEPTEVENKEERLANLKIQLEQDGDQLSDDEKEAIENEIADLEKEVYPEANLNEDSDEQDEDSDEQDEDSDEQDEDSDDFTTDMNTILDAIKSIDVTSFGTHKAEEVVDTLIDICNRQINREGPEIIDDSNADLDKDSDSDEESEVEPIQDSEKKPVTEAATKGLKVTQNQGNIYMLEDENKKIYVGENYNENEHILENAEIYDSAEDAQKDYLSRCDITKTEN